jgi:FkbM family methyltransferase
MKPIQRLVAIKDQILSDLDEIKRTNQQTVEHVTRAVGASTDDLRHELEEMSQIIEEKLGKTNWQLSSTANTLKELREIVYEYCIPTQDPYSYPASTAAYRFDTPELSLLQYLRSFVPTRNAVDIGAHSGMASDLLLSAGYKVFAFEPNNDVYEGLCNRFEEHADFKAYPLAVGADDGHATLHMIGRSEDVEHLFAKDLSIYATLVKHAVPDGLWYKDREEVQVRSLKTLHQSRQIPLDVCVVFIDTEGGELDILRGMGKATYNCVVAKFWDSKYYFSEGTIGILPEIVSEMRKRSYSWHIVIYRVFDGESSSDPRWYANVDQSVEQSWGYVSFFRDFSLFTEAFKWCTANLRQNETFR